MIVGITGPIASGKSVLSNMFVEKGFIKLSLSEEVRKEAKKLGLAIERTTLQNLGNQMRVKLGNGFWARKLIETIDPEKNYVVEGIRNPGEVEELRKEFRNFVLIGVTAPIENRIEWIKARNKDSDPKTIEGIRAIDSRDRGFGESDTGQRSEDCFAMADSYIFNNTNLEDLREKAAQIVNEMGIKE